MNVPEPDLDDLRSASDALGLALDDDALAMYLPYVAGMAAGLGRLDELTPPMPPRPDRAPGWKPEPADNPLGAWYRRCSIREQAQGPLSGSRVVVKDNVMVAGIEMANGSAALDGFVPDTDATVVSRILAAGGEIVGKAVCEDLCVSAGSHTSFTGAVHNPLDLDRTSGGSSSGSAALLAAGECELAIGGDQGGSIRIPAAYCGLYGLKPTHGLVPYTGAFPLDPTIDHLGPMATTTADVARLLDVIAGPDGLDPRQRDVEVRPYVDGLDRGAAGLRIGVVAEGFGHGDDSGPVDAVVRESAQVFAGLGAEVVDVSVRWHRDAGVVGGAILGQGLVMTGLYGNAAGAGWSGHYAVDLMEAWGRACTEHPEHLPHTARLMALGGEHARRSGFGTTYGKAQNLVPVVTAAYDAVLTEVDILVMPTAPTVAPELPPDDAGFAESVAAAFRNASNTTPFDVTGHPSMSIPCGRVGGLPVGMMLTGRRWADDVVLAAAAAFESTGHHR